MGNEIYSGSVQNQMQGLAVKQSLRERMEQKFADFEKRGDDIKAFLDILDREPALEKILEKIKIGYL